MGRELGRATVEPYFFVKLPEALGKVTRGWVSALSRIEGAVGGCKFEGSYYKRAIEEGSENLSLETSAAAVGDKGMKTS